MSAGATICPPTAATFLKAICSDNDRPTGAGEYVFATGEFRDGVEVSRIGTGTAQRPIGITFTRPPDSKLPELQQYFTICCTGIASLKLDESNVRDAKLGAYVYCNAKTGDVTMQSDGSSVPVAMILEAWPLDYVARVLMLSHAG